MRIQLHDPIDALIAAGNGTFRLLFHVAADRRAGFRDLLKREGWEVTEVRLPVSSPDPGLPRARALVTASA